MRVEDFLERVEEKLSWCFVLLTVMEEEKADFLKTCSREVMWSLECYGTTMNAERYIEILTRFRKRLGRVRPQCA
ncbi:hypothetical protein NPIL_11021 [Nephila pilipes]|uniref:Uncharacterized protein n=1 Tax=Nephila pilipes TaxID=299642 RepID=A0A8X6NT60_NEPPI|nr:hypothetical protein NPIL_11021 [Nephila pilipes]